jgi:predicted GIY-YIG superfamily endonuclease
VKTDLLDVTVQWYGPISLSRVEQGEYTEGMLGGEVGIYHWGTKTSSLYIGKAEDVVARQRKHLREQLGQNLKHAKRRGEDVLFWCGPIKSAEFCGRISEKRGRYIVSAVERALIVQTDPLWNRSERGYADFDEPVRILNAGHCPPTVKRTVRVSGRQVRL